MSYEILTRLFLERGFFFPSSEIYPDAPAGFWEAGPLGAQMRRRFEELWRRELVRRDGMLEIDGSQIMSKSVFIASGHLESFVDPIAECTNCHAIHRIDKLLEENLGHPIPERLSEREFDELIAGNRVSCPKCKGSLGPTRLFNMMFRLGVGGSGEEAYLRPETCQSIFVDFPRLYKVMRCKLPIAFAQWGKSFRNEISPRQGLIRLREFYQAEIEIFFNPKRDEEFERLKDMKGQRIRLLDIRGRVVEEDCSKLVEDGHIPYRLMGYYLGLLWSFYEKTGMDMNRARFRQLSEQERAFYAQVAFDFEVETSLGWIELVACNYRTDYDLRRHGEVSKKDMSVEDGGEKVIPHIFELSMGVDRSLYCLLEHSYAREEGREVLRLRPYLAPLQFGIFPLVSKDGLPEKARSIYEALRKDFDCTYDESGSIGRRYRRIDEVGAPYAITVDYQTLQDDTVTLRFRDSMEQIRLNVKELPRKMEELLRYPS